MIRQFVISGHVNATSRFKLSAERQSELTQVTNLVNEYHGKITNVVTGIDRNIGPFGNVIQDVTITVEGDYDDPKFKELYDKYNAGSTQSSGGGCYVATAVYGSYNCPEVWTLRRYRDYMLAQTWYGRAFIRTYYAISPVLVKWFGNKKWFKNLWKPALDKMVSKLNHEGIANTPYQDRNW